MQKLVRLQTGRICNYWVPNGLPAGAEIIGDVIPGERGEWLVQNPDKSISVDATLKSTILSQEAARETAEQDERTQAEQLRRQLKTLITEIQNASTAAEIKAVLVKIVKYLAFTQGR